MKRIIQLSMICLLISVMANSAMALSFTNTYDASLSCKQGDLFTHWNRINYDTAGEHQRFFGEMKSGHTFFSTRPNILGSLGERGAVDPYLAALRGNHHGNSTSLDVPVHDSTSAPHPTPEPASMLLMSIGLSFFAFAKGNRAFSPKD